jgi:MFS transporter, DHA1 family, tetracycline resistance protein
MMTKRVGVDEQGQLQGANSSLMGIAGMVGPTIFTLVFNQAAHWGNKYQVSLVGAPFYLAAALHVVALGIAIYLFARHASPHTIETQAHSH